MSDYKLRKKGRRSMKLEIECEDVNWIKQDQHVGLWHLVTNKTWGVFTKKTPIFKTISPNI
jgi:hypothetical protein